MFLRELGLEIIFKNHHHQFAGDGGPSCVEESVQGDARETSHFLLVSSP